MNDSIIKIENLSKQYRIGATKAPYNTFRESLGKIMRAPFQRVAKLMRGKVYGATDLDETIWALKDVSFEVKRGEVIGIIGRNGSGKSTLLKILSRVTEPTEGKAKIRGRVGSLLEVGTGFHPELTGRENIFLNGAILGMRRREIIKKFDEIVAFAEIEKFIDTPIKFYSSGMYVRLAFAVAAHLELEILLVDEVLAVGDVAFQNKCLGKMGEVAKGGRTVLFVSHNMGIITTLCKKTILLKEGKIVLLGKTEDAIANYLELNAEDGTRVLPIPIDSDTYFTKVAILDDQMNPTTNLDIRKDYFISLEYVIQKNIPGLEVAFYVCNKIGIKIFTSSKQVCANGQCSKNIGRYRSIIKIPKLLITPDKYSISTVLHQPKIMFHALRENIIFFQLHETGSTYSVYKGVDNGVIIVNLEWQTEKKRSA